MKHPKQSILSKDGISYLIPFVLITSCFALWGFANDITNPMVKAFSKIFRMSATDGALVQVAFYGGYFAMAFPAAIFIRKYTCLQLSFLPYLRPGRAILPLDGGVRIGDDLLVLRLSDEGTIDASLPDGLWAELSGLCWTGRCRQIRGYNALPVLIRENALFPVGVNDRTTDADDADLVVLHWFQPDFTTECTLADGTFYRVTQIGAGFRWETNATKEWHLIIHRGSEEQFVR